MTIEQERDIAVRALREVASTTGDPASARTCDDALDAIAAQHEACRYPNCTCIGGTTSTCAIAAQASPVDPAIKESLQVAEASPVAQDERSKFEAWAQTCDGNCNDMELRKYPDDHPIHAQDPDEIYFTRSVQRDWVVWSAALASVAVPAMTDGCAGFQGLPIATCGVCNGKGCDTPAAQPVGEAVAFSRNAVLDEVIKKIRDQRYMVLNPTQPCAHERVRAQKDLAESFADMIRRMKSKKIVAPPVAQDQGAARYRWLREKHDDGDEQWFVYGANDKLDAAIDAAMQAEGKK